MKIVDVEEYEKKDSFFIELGQPRWLKRGISGKGAFLLQRKSRASPPPLQGNNVSEGSASQMVFLEKHRVIFSFARIWPIRVLASRK